MRGWPTILRLNHAAIRLGRAIVDGYKSAETGSGGWPEL